MKTLDSFDQAKDFFASHAEASDEWVTHSFKVAEVTGRIAKALIDAGADVDAEDLRIKGLFHDIGRSRDHGYLHGWSGYQLLEDAGLLRFAKPCVAHWLKGRAITEVMREGAALDEELVRHIFELTGCAQFDLDEKIVSLADSMTSFNKIVTVRERYREARTRYGESDWLDTNERISEEIKAELDRMLGYDLYSLFDETGEDSR